MTDLPNAPARPTVDTKTNTRASLFWSFAWTGGFAAMAYNDGTLQYMNTNVIVSGYGAIFVALLLSFWASFTVVDKIDPAPFFRTVLQIVLSVVFSSVGLGFLSSLGI